MNEAGRDRITGIVLMAAAVLWCWGVIATIPAAEDASRLGSRGFPLGLGVLLGLLGLFVLLSSFGPPPDAAQHEAGGGRVPLATELWGVLSTLVLIIGYAFAMEQLGFVLATLAVIVVAMVAVLGMLRPVLTIGLALGMAGGIYLVFGKLLGVYLPHGQLVDLAF